MKKNRLTYILPLLLIVFAAPSCKKSFLEVVPKGYLIPTTLDDYDKLMNFSGFYMYDPGLYQPAILMGDDVASEAANFNGTSYLQARLFFQWQKDIFLPSSDIGSTNDNPPFLAYALSNIYKLNLIINNVGDATTGTSQDKAALKAEALANRAFIQFQLLNYFAKPYNASTASSDPGFPVITTADAAATDFQRGTVQQSYDAVIADLQAAIPALKIQPAFQTRMSKAAAQTILAKVYLFMGNHAQALQQMDDAFTTMATMNNKPVLYDYNVEFASGGSFLPINDQSGPNSPFNNATDVKESLLAKFAYAGGYSGTGYPNTFLTITPQTVALYQPADLRLKLYTNKQANLDPIPVAPGDPGRLRKYGLRYSRIGVQLAEMYLLRAEERVRNNNLQGAAEDLLALRINRMPAADAIIPAAISGDKTALLKFVLDEREREFACEGFRWFDMRRLSADPLFSGQPTVKHTLYGLDGKKQQEFTLTPERLTLKLPPKYLAAHPGMPDNP